MKNASIFLLFCSIQFILADNYELNEAALHLDARRLAMGGLVCDLTPSPKKILEITYLIPFQIKELSIRKLTYSSQFARVNWSIGWYQSGDQDWTENNLNLKVGKQLNEALYFGIRINFLSVDDAIKNRSSICFAELDCKYELSEKTTIGLTLVNPSGTNLKIGHSSITLSSAYFLGSRYTPTKKCALFCELGALTKKPLDARLGLEYELQKTFVLRTGLNTDPMMPTWGIGGSINKIKYAWAGNLHPILGISNGFTLTICW